MSSSPPAPSPSWAYFLDFDGTLVEIAPTPDAVHLAPEARQVLRGLFAATGGAMALVTGRSIEDLDRIVGAPSFPASGQHGLEWRDGAHLPIAMAASPALGGARARLAELAARHPAILLEDKGLSLAVHYRRAPELASVAHAAVERELQQLDGYRLQHGKCVVELRPAAGGKASAVAALLARPPFAGRVPVFVGDDLTDEEAFVLVNARGGLSVHVGPGPTAARCALPDPRAVIAWLGQVSLARVP